MAMPSPARNALETVQQWLVSLHGNDSSNEGPVLDANGRSLITDNLGTQVLLQVAPANGQVYFYSPVSAVASGGKAAMIERCMSLNLIPGMMPGAHLGWDQGASAIMLCYFAPLESLNAKRLPIVLGLLCATARVTTAALAEAA